VSVLSGPSIERLAAAYRRSPILKFAVNLAVEVRRGVVCYVGAHHAAASLEDRVIAKFSELGTLFRVAERDLPIFSALGISSTALIARVAAALVESGVGLGLDRSLAATVVPFALEGTGSLIRARANEAAEVVRSVAVPDGRSIRGVLILEAAKIPETLNAAIRAIVDSFDEDGTGSSGQHDRPREAG